MTTDNHALEQAKAQAASIAEMVTALECDYDRLEILRSERESYVRSIDGPPEEDTPENWAIDLPTDAAELAELEVLAGDCASRDEARERIQDDPLSVEVRSGWASSKDDFEAEEFQILLCTGGPAVRIMGELAHGEPSRAWIEYQDWGTPWALAPGLIDSETLLTYCRQFYFGD